MRHWIFDISPSSNSKLRYKVRHEVTDAAQSVFRTRVRGIIAGIKLKRLRVADIFFEKGTGCWSKLPAHSAGENACGPTDNPRENRQVGSGTRQD